MPRPPLQKLEPKKINFFENISSLKFIPRFFGRIWNISPSLFLVNLSCRFADAFIPLAMLWTGKKIIDEVILQMNQEVKNFHLLWIYIALEFGLAILSDLLSRAISYTDGLLGDRYANASSVELIRKTAELDLEQLEDSEFYDKLERARQQTTSRIGLMSNVLSQAQDVIVIISLLAGIVAFEPWLILLLIISVVPTVINEIKFSGTSYSLTRSWTPERRELDYLRYAGASDVTAKEVKLFGLSGYLAERFSELSNRYYLASRALSAKRALWGSGFSLLSTSAYYGAYLLIILRTVSGVLSIGDLTFLSGSFNRLRTKLQGFFTRFTYITESSLYLGDYFDFLDLSTNEASEKELIDLPQKMKTGLQLRNVGFKYPKSDQWVIRNISFDLKAGEKLAFVGENGAGKTTLIKLILRFYDPTEGEILLDGMDIKKYKKDQYQQYFGVIFQDFVKYELTTRENIAVGKINEIENETRIENAASLSLASEVLNQLPKGLNQQLGKRFAQGKELSGGQWQKIALARAYMKNAEILILDEPTSALDARAEYEAFQRFIGLTQGKTAIIISHRFSTVRMADRILVLKNGALLEIGTHEELMRNKLLYSELFSLQAAGYQ